MHLIESVKKTIIQADLIKKGDKIVVAVSGGPDSVFLLYTLNMMRFDLGIRLQVAHINHGLRKGARADQAFVEKLARQMDLPISIVSLKNLKIKDAGSLEEKARNERYKALIRIAKKNKTASIAVGHTEDDLAETVIMRIIRGSGLMGMQAILPDREMNGARIIRPILGIRKKDIQNFLKKNKIPFRSDPSNRDKNFFRNKIRLELLPNLAEKYNPSISTTLAHLSDTVSIDYDYLQSEAQRVFPRVVSQNGHSNKLNLKLSVIQKLHPALQRMVLRMAVQKLKGNTRTLTLQHIKEIEDLLLRRPTGAVVDLPNRLYVRKRLSVLTISRRKT